MKISEAIKFIVDQNNKELLTDSNKFKAYLLDLCSDNPKELKIVKRALEDKILERIFGNERDNVKIARLRDEFEDQGMSEDWSEFVISSFAEVLGWNYTPKVQNKQAQSQPQQKQQTNQEQNQSSNQINWTCSCGFTNTTKFCGNCGLPKPIPKTISWTCSCGFVNTTKFCGNCGKPNGGQQSAEEEARRKAEQEARRKAEEEARRRAEEARRRAEEARKRAEEARRKAEEARRKAEEEARRKAEEEARRKAEQEARRKAEEEARKRAEEARRKAEEARRKAEEARRKAEEEARKRAEEEARKKAEEEARKRRQEEYLRQINEKIKIEREKHLRIEEEAKRKAEEEALLRIEKFSNKIIDEETRLKAEEEAKRNAEIAEEAFNAYFGNLEQEIQEEARKFKNFVLEVINGVQKGQTFDLESDKITIGRRIAPKERKRDWILIEDSSLSRIHAFLEWDSDRKLYKAVLKATNKTLIINGESVAEGYLYHSDKLQLGDVIFRIWDGKLNKSFIKENNPVQKFEIVFEHSNSRDINILSENIKDINIKSLVREVDTFSLRNAKVGDYIKFGNYPQSANGGIAPIEWQVLSKENNKMLVISKYGLEARCFDSSSNNWKNSEIREWANNDFYNKAFNEYEKKLIRVSNISTTVYEKKKKSGLFESLFGQEEIVESNELTDDKVFLLSKEGTEKYFTNNDVRMCKATEYAVKNGAYVADNGYSWWWLRFPDPNYSYRVYYVDNFGLIDYCYVSRDDYVARPALWINI